MRWLVLWLMIFFPTLGFAEYSNVNGVSEGITTEDCSEFFPTTIRDNRQRDLLTICRLNYAVIYDRQCRIPLLTFENLRPDEVDGNEPRTNRFRADPALFPEDRAELSDYVKSGYDRGHMVPAGDMREDSVAMQQSFYLSNIIPQNPSVNRGIWKVIERNAREMVTAYNGDTYVVTGAVAPRRPTRIGDGVCVPAGMFKMIIQGRTVRTYWVPNREGGLNIQVDTATLFGLSGFQFEAR